MSLSRSDKRWTALAAVVAALFSWWEGEAYAHKDPAETLSIFTRRVLGLGPKRWRRFVLVPILWVVCLWFPIHISWNTLGIPVGGK